MAYIHVWRGGVALSNMLSHEVDQLPKPTHLWNTLEAAVKPKLHRGSHVQGKDS